MARPAQYRDTSATHALNAKSRGSQHFAMCLTPAPLHRPQSSGTFCIPDAASEGGWPSLKGSAGFWEAGWLRALAVPGPDADCLASLCRCLACLWRASISSRMAALTLATSDALAGWQASKALQAWRAACASDWSSTQERKGAGTDSQQELPLPSIVHNTASSMRVPTCSSPSSFSACMRLRAGLCVVGPS